MENQEGGYEHGGERDSQLFYQNQYKQLNEELQDQAQFQKFLDQKYKQLRDQNSDSQRSTLKIKLKKRTPSLKHPSNLGPRKLSSSVLTRAG